MTNRPLLPVSLSAIFPGLLLVLALLSAAPETSHAQGTADPQAVELIIGTQVQEDEATSRTLHDEVIAAIENIEESTSMIHKVWRLDAVDILFLPDAAATEGGPPAEIAAKLHEKRAEIQQMRAALEGNAMLFHAVNSRQLLVQDILAVEFADTGKVRIFAAGTSPNG